MSDTIRIDKWLWYARFFKTRSLAAKTVQVRKVRINGAVATKASVDVRPDDVLTFPQGREIRVVRVSACGARRGPASEAATLYEDLSPLEPRRDETSPALRNARTGRIGARPTKAQRRALDQWLDRDPGE